jgi:uncharacterized membrane protein
MDKRIKQLFIISLPAIIVVLISFYSYRQNILANNDDQSDTVISRIELPFKNINADHLLLAFTPNIRYLALSLEASRNYIAPIFLSKQKEKIININNNSPPDNKFL